MREELFKEENDDNWAKGSLEEFIWLRCEANNRYTREIMIKIYEREIELLEGMKIPNYSSVKASFEYKLVDDFNQKLDAMIAQRKLTEGD